MSPFPVIRSISKREREREQAGISLKFLRCAALIFAQLWLSQSQQTPALTSLLSPSAAGAQPLCEERRRGPRNQHVKTSASAFTTKKQEPVDNPTPPEARPMLGAHVCAQTRCHLPGWVCSGQRGKPHVRRRCLTCGEQNRPPTLPEKKTKALNKPSPGHFSQQQS